MVAYPSYRTLGIRVDGVQIPDVVITMREWIADSSPTRYIAVTGMHGVTEAQSDVSFKKVLNDADLVVPDGMPLVWLARRSGIPLERRVYGPELMETFLVEAGANYRHFLYGGAPGVADHLAKVMEDRFQCQVAGTYCPPYRRLNQRESDHVVEMINGSGADLIWVGLSTPKQERWMHEYRGLLRVPVVVGVGAAFDFLTERKKAAPMWMQEHGFEWLFRLMSEPRRLWRRYIIGGAKFGTYLLLQSIGLRNFEVNDYEGPHSLKPDQKPAHSGSTDSVGLGASAGTSDSDA